MNKIAQKVPYAQLFLLGLCYNILALFHVLLPSWVVAIAGLIFVAIFIAKVSKFFTFPQSLLLSTIALIPSSFLSMAGTSYANLPVSLFSLSIILLFLIILRKRTLEPWFAVSFLFFIIFALLSLTWVEYPLSALKQAANIGVFLLSFSICAYFYMHESSKQFLRTCIVVYIQTAVIFAFTVILQKVFIDTTGTVIGNYGEYALGRQSYAGLMGDFSFASLYIATGVIILLFAYLQKNVKNLSTLLLGEALLIGSLVITNARTGLFALAAATLVGAIAGLFKANVKAVVLSIFVGIIILVSGLGIYSNRGEQSLIDGSSRSIEYSSGIQTFVEHPLVGIGFGDENYEKYLGDNPLPHNFYIQYLMQGGIIGLSIILASFLLFLRLPLTKDKGIVLVLVAVFIGSMFVPDIFSSRYLSIIIIIAFVSCGTYVALKNEKTHVEA